MAKYCVNQNEFLEGISKKKKFLNMDSKPKTSSSKIKECFIEYTLQDKVEALKNLLNHNEKHEESKPSYITNIRKTEKTIGVKECLHANPQTAFQTLISELRNTTINSYWNKEIGKTRYQIPNLPVGMNPLEVTFGKKTVSKITMAELLKEQVNEDTLNENILEMYKKSHNSYLPAEQIKRNYKKPFDIDSSFGKRTNVSSKSERIKKLLSWIITDSNEPEVIECPCTQAEKIRDLKYIDLYTNMIHGRKYEKKNDDMRNILNECSLSDETIMLHNYLKYINGLRLQLKKRVPEVPYGDVLEDLIRLDKDYTEILPEDQIIPILTKYKIHINETLLMPLLDLLQIRKEKNVNYRNLLQLLNCRYDFPTLPKIDELPVECQYYNTTYNETIGDINKRDTTSTFIAGISYKSLEADTAYGLIFPDTFTRYGLSHLDFSKPRSKEEIKDIFDSIGIQFPDDNFDSIWEEEYKKSGKKNLSIENFKHWFGHCNY